VSAPFTGEERGGEKALSEIATEQPRCVICGRPCQQPARFLRQLKGAPTCSADCRAKLRHAQKAGETRTCPQCGRQFYRRRSLVQSGRAKYCSLSCRGLAQRARAERQCATCGKIFLPRSASNRFCSFACYNEGGRQPRGGPSAPPWWVAARRAGFHQNQVYRIISRVSAGKPFRPFMAWRMYRATGDEAWLDRTPYSRPNRFVGAFFDGCMSHSTSPSAALSKMGMSTSLLVWWLRDPDMVPTSEHLAAVGAWLGRDTEELRSLVGPVRRGKHLSQQAWRIMPDKWLRWRISNLIGIRRSRGLPLLGDDDVDRIVAETMDDFHLSERRRARLVRLGRRVVARGLGASAKGGRPRGSLSSELLPFMDSIHSALGGGLTMYRIEAIVRDTGLTHDRVAITRAYKRWCRARGVRPNL
jgi:hypothetical protein